MGSVAIHALSSGLVLSVSLAALLLIVLRANPEIMLNDYPPDVKAKWGPMTERSRRQRTLVIAVVLVVLLGVVAWSLKALPRVDAGDVSFRVAFVHFAIMFGTFNLFDWLLLDWPLVYWQPRFMVLPGTEGLSGYSDYWFHFRGFLIGIPIVLAASALFAAVVSLVF